MKTLILVDIQNDFCPGGALPVPNGDKVVDVVNSIIDKFDDVVCTMDWHPDDHVSFALTHDAEVGTVIELDDGTPQMLWPVHCVEDSDGAQIHSGIKLPRNMTIPFTKGENPSVDSYSGFFDNGCKSTTELNEYLDDDSELYICGLATDYCVKFTALDAVELGYTTYLIIDACRAVDLPEGNEALAIQEMIDAGVKIITSSEIPNG